MVRSRVLAFILLSFLTISSLAQSSKRETVTQSVQWFALSTHIKVHNSVSILAEGQLRYAQHFDPMQFQFRTGLDFTINKHFSVLPIGYVYTWNPLYGKQPATYVNNEHRLFQQVIYKHHIGRINLSHRLRMEERFIQVHSNTNGEVVSQGYDMHLNRLRYRFMANIPVNQDKMEAKTVYVSFYDEVFYSWGKPITYNEPDQNRIYAGLGYQFTKALSVQGGAFYQLLIKSNGSKQENNVGFQVQVYYNIDLTRKE